MANMTNNLPHWLRRRVRNLLILLSPARQFLLGSLAIMIAGMSLLGWWIAWQLERGVVLRTSEAVALYVDSLLSAPLQELSTRPRLSDGSIRELRWLLNDTGLGRQIVALKIWSADGTIIYSDNPTLIGQQFAVEDELAESWRGAVVGSMSDLNDPENIQERAVANRLLEIYTPVRAGGSGRVIAVAEFYQRIDTLEAEIFRAQATGWVVVISISLLMYLVLVGFVGQLSRTITRQRNALTQQVDTLLDLLAQNRDLDQRVRRAAFRTTELQERFRRRLSSELHDGPAQYLGLALLRLDRLTDACQATANPERTLQDLDVIRNALTQTMQEVRAISGGLGIPQLDKLTLQQTIERVVRAHERRTNTKVQLSISDLPAQVALPIKITTYRVIQEALSNAFRHAGGVGQEVAVTQDEQQLALLISDQGPGMGLADTEWGEHMGLAGMRERVESLGGLFQIESVPGQGCQIHIQLPLTIPEEINE
jgi:signal transduction histidine kinase